MLRSVVQAMPVANKETSIGAPNWLVLDP